MTAGDIPQPERESTAHATVYERCGVVKLQSLPSGRESNAVW